MPKTNHTKGRSLVPALLILVVVLAVLSLSLGVALLRQRSSTTAVKAPSISLGSMGYDFSSGKAVKRDDVSVNTLRAFLTADATKEGCQPSAPAFEHVAAYSKDESQVLLRFGCGAADSLMFAVKTNGSWKMLSPTNHFDAFGIPDCAYVNSNAIAREIAPVCANNVSVGVATGNPAYKVR